MREMYVVKVEGEEARLFFSDGQPVGSWDYEDIFTALRMGRNTQSKQETDSSMRHLLDSIHEWVYPRKRTDIFASGPSVYFLECEGRPDLIKVGRTTNLASRTKGICRLEKAAVRVIAFARTPKYKKLERAIHAYLHKARIDGEWFMDSEVLDFLDTHGGAS